MSDQYLFHLRFDVRKDAPASLHKALTALAEGRELKPSEMSDLPGIVQEYLRYGGVPGDGVQLYHYLGPIRKFRDGKLVEVEFEPHEGSHSLRMSRTFHDDEYFNGGMYFPYWIFQFAAYDGPIATMQQTNGNDLPMVITKHGDRLIETRLVYQPERFWPSGELAGPDVENPVVVQENRNLSISELIESLSVFKDGHDYG